METIRRGILPQKKVLVISPDALPFKFFEEKVNALSEEEKTLFLNKVIRVTALGYRAYHTADQFAKSGMYEVTVAVPHYNFIHQECINTSGLFFKPVEYNYDNAMFKFSDELKELIDKNDIVVVQTTAGVGFKNCIECNKIVVVDGWVPLGIEYPTSISETVPDETKKKLLWDTFKKDYFDLIKKANVILFANLSQKFYYLGILSALGEINYQNFKHSKLLKVSFSVDDVEPLKITYNKNDTFNLVWFGPMYPWYNPYILLDSFQYLESKNITLTFVGAMHPRYSAYNRKFLAITQKYKKVKIIPEYTPISNLKNFHLAVILSFNYLEKDVAHRCRLLHLASYGIPVCTNKQDNVGTILQKYNLSYLISTLNPKDLSEEICKIRDSYTSPDYSKIKKFQESLSHEKSFESLVGYFLEDKKWKLI